MKYLVLKSTDPYLNLATEEYLLDTADDDIFMLWQNDNVVVIGKNQNAYAEVNTEYLKKRGIKIARRITGGGAVYHDMGNVNYTFISSREKANALDFAYFTAPIVDALNSLGVVAELSGRNDLLCNGKKFSGNAQYSSETKILHHGTLLFDSDLNVLSDVLKVDPEKIESKAIKSTKSRVTNLKSELKKDVTPSEFIELILTYVKKKYAAEEIPVPPYESVKELYGKYSSHEWIYSDRKFLNEFSVRRKKRYPFGIVDLYLTLDRDIIRKINISGDFFGTKGKEELEKLLAGCELAEEPLKNRLDGFKVTDCIFGMDNETFIELIMRGEE